MQSRIITLALVLLTWLAPELLAQRRPLTLEIRNGLVSLSAQNVPAGQILAEWARVGTTKIVNGEGVTGAPLTLEFSNMPERQALDIVLRGVAGYMLAARQPSSTGASAFDRILILPNSSALRTPPAPGATPSVQASRPLGPPPILARPPLAVEDTADQDDIEPDEPPTEIEPVEPIEPPSPATPRPRVIRPRVTPPFALPNLPRRPPSAQPPNAPPDVEPVVVDEPASGVTPTTPGNPFGVPVGSSSTPGMAAPAPRPPVAARP